MPALTVATGDGAWLDVTAPCRCLPRNGRLRIIGVNGWRPILFAAPDCQKHTLATLAGERIGGGHVVRCQRRPVRLLAWPIQDLT